MDILWLACSVDASFSFEVVNLVEVLRALQISSPNVLFASGSVIIFVAFVLNCFQLHSVFVDVHLVILMSCQTCVRHRPSLLCQIVNNWLRPFFLGVLSIHNSHVCAALR